MRGYPRTGIGALVVLGSLLVAHPLWTSIPSTSQVYSLSGAQWFTLIGWMYLMAGAAGAGGYYLYGADLTPRRLLTATLPLYPVLVGLFWTGVLQLTPAVHKPVEFVALVFPAALAFPMGTAARTARWKELSVGALLCLVLWTLFYGSMSNSLSIFSLLFALALYLFVSIYALPTFVFGVVAAPELSDSGRDEETDTASKRTTTARDELD